MKNNQKLYFQNIFDLGGWVGGGWIGRECTENRKKSMRYITLTVTWHFDVFDMSLARSIICTFLQDTSSSCDQKSIYVVAQLYINHRSITGQIRHVLQEFISIKK